MTTYEFTLKLNRAVTGGGITASAIAALHVLITADRVLAARDALRTEPDDLARAEFERLLEDA
jgi:hypothetical protein